VSAPALPCPPWCTSSHDNAEDDISCHHHTSRNIGGDFETGWVSLVMNDWSGSILSGSNGEINILVHWQATGTTARRPLDQADKFAELAEALGRADVAALIRELAAFAAGPVHTREREPGVSATRRPPPAALPASGR
jgi:hypothetical protein